VITHAGNRFRLPEKIIDEILPSMKATHIFANMEYEVDELRRDIEVLEYGAKQNVRAMFVHDRLAVPPGTFKTGQGKPYGVFSPWQRKWQAFLEAHEEHLYEAADPEGNEDGLRSHPIYGKLFDGEVPECLEGFECRDRDLMKVVWPEGNEVAVQVGFSVYARRKLFANAILA
jgi:deoxyribodipyrimidine photo-lyase